MEVAALSQLILARSQSHILFTGWSAKCSSLKSSRNLNLVSADDKQSLAADQIVHVDVTLEGGEDAALSLGATASLPCLIRYQVEDTSGHSPVTTWILESVESDAQVLEFVHATNIKAVPSSALVLLLPASSTETKAEPSVPVAAAASPAAAVPGTFLSEQHATIRRIADSGGCVRIFVAGDKTHCGKTTIALGILGTLFRAGIPASQLAYIKPATQCEAPDLLAAWCEAKGVSHVAGAEAPLVFFKGFTREFLAGRAGTSAEWIDKVTAAVDALAVNKRFLVVDGVGFPGVGTCVGVSNAETATAARAPVLLVGACGVGGCIDAYAHNARFFTAAQVPVLGLVANRGALEGFYRYDACRESLQAWFTGRRQREALLGVVPEAPDLAGARETVAAMTTAQALAAAEANISHVEAHVNVADLMLAASADPWNRNTSGRRAALFSHVTTTSPSSSAPTTGSSGAAAASSSSLPPPAGSLSRPSRDSLHGTSTALPFPLPPPAAPVPAASSNKTFSREAIEAAAAAQGAKGG